ncbi:MAG: sugar ABC transporter permease [Lachnospiraceae bacterium]|nr:sugar ABC transporter permease [Lachnospiraceae bacterium]
MCLPAVVYILLFAYKPMYGILIAFKNFKIKLGVWDSPWVGFDNFERLFNSYWFPVILKNTVLISGLSIILTFPLPIILALMVNEIRNGAVRKGFQIISYAPHFISTVVVCSMVIMFTSPTSGIINQALTVLGGEAINFMGEPDMFKWVYIISGIWQGTGWGAIIYIATLSSVDKSLHEAAEIDGANRFQRIIHINVPVLMPTIVIMLILRFGQVMSVGYEKVYLLQNATNLSVSEVISTYVYKVGLENAEFSFSTAVGLFNSLVNCFFLIVVNKIADKLSGSSLF